MKILPFESGPVATIGYLAIDDPSGSAMLVDAPFGCADAVDAAVRAEGATLTTLVLTHTHWDHTGDAAELKRRFPETQVLVHSADRHRLEDPMAHTIWPLPFEIEGISPDRLLNDGDTIHIGAVEFVVLHTPGHTEGGICLHSAGEKLLFAGDTLFAGSVGRTDLPGGDFPTLLASISGRLFALPGDTVVLPGHGEPTTIAREMESNPFVGS